MLHRASMVTGAQRQPNCLTCSYTLLYRLRHLAYLHATCSAKLAQSFQQSHTATWIVCQCCKGNTVTTQSSGRHWLTELVELWLMMSRIGSRAAVDTPIWWYRLRTAVANTLMANTNRQQATICIHHCWSAMHAGCQLNKAACGYCSKHVVLAY